QRMSAGTGIMHSEMNASEDNPVHFLQIWILPEEKGIEPGYEQKYFAPDTRQDQWRLVGSRDGRDGIAFANLDAFSVVGSADNTEVLLFDLAE
ncbi:MAG: pirin family protein, partial [Cyanobacteria bacterium J06632_3]